MHRLLPCAVLVASLLAAPAGANDRSVPFSARSELLLVWNFSLFGIDTREDLQLTVFRNGAAHAASSRFGLRPNAGQRVLDAIIPVEAIRALEAALREAGISRLSGAAQEAGIPGHVTASFVSYPPDRLVKLSEHSPVLRRQLRALLQARINEFSIDVFESDLGAKLNHIVDLFIAEWFPELRRFPR